MPEAAFRIVVAVVAVLLLGTSRLASSADFDGDGSETGVDLCSFVPDVHAASEDCNGDGDTDDPGEAPGEACDTDLDGIGDACECGNLVLPGLFDADDVSRLRTALADPTGQGLSPDEQRRCSVIGSANSCDVTDVVVMSRALSLLEPGVSQDCAAAKPERVFDCARDGYPCDLRDVAVALLNRIDTLVQESNVLLNAGQTLDQVQAVLDAENDVVRTVRTDLSLAFRVAGAPPSILHDAAAARQIDDPGSPAAASALAQVTAFPPSGPPPVAQRVVGQDRNQDGRRDRAKRALVITPFADQFLIPGIVVPDEQFRALEEYADADVVTLEDSGPIETLLDWDQHEAIILNTHGDVMYDPMGGEDQLGQFGPPLVFTRRGPDAATPSCPEVQQALDEEGFVLGPIPGDYVCASINTGTTQTPLWTPATALVPEYFEILYGDGLDHTFVYFNACRGTLSEEWADVLLGEDSAFLGWDEYVTLGNVWISSQAFFIAGLDWGLPVARAYSWICEAGLCREFITRDCIPPTCGVGGAPSLILYRDSEGADLRLREALSFVDPETGGTPDPADRHPLARGFVGQLDDGVPDQIAVRVILHGFESFDFVDLGDPDFARKLLTLGAASDSGPPFLLPSFALGTLLEARPNFEYRTTLPIPLALGFAVNTGDLLQLDVELDLPRKPDGVTVPNGPTRSYAERQSHTVESCSYNATLSGAVAGNFLGGIVTVTQTGAYQVVAQSNTFFAQVLADLVGSSPGAIQSVGVIVNGQDFNWFAFAPGGLPDPSLTIIGDDGETVQGILSATLSNGLPPPDDATVTLQMTFDGDLPPSLGGVCVR